MNILKKLTERIFIKELIPVYDRNGKQLLPGQICKVHPHGGQCKEPYYVIVQKLSTEVNGCNTGLQTYIPDKWACAIHEYLCKQLEIIGMEKEFKHLLYNQKLY